MFFSTFLISLSDTNAGRSDKYPHFFAISTILHIDNPTKATFFPKEAPILVSVLSLVTFDANVDTNTLPVDSLIIFVRGSITSSSEPDAPFTKILVESHTIANKFSFPRDCNLFLLIPSPICGL